MQIKEIWLNAVMRIGVAIVLLGAVLGGIDYWIEIEHVDENVVRLAQKSSHEFVSRHLDAENPFADSAKLEQSIRAELLHYFPIVELYDAKQEKRLEVIAEGKEWVEDALKGQRHGFPDTSEPIYHRIDVGNDTFIQIIIPLKSGFFEGVYQIDPATLAAINEEMVKAVMMVVLSIIVTGVILSPLLMGLNRQLLKNSRAILRANIELMEVLGSAIAKRDSDTNTHNYRVTLYAIALAEAIKLPDESMRTLIAGAFLHDVGKIGIPDAILLKPGKLDEDEFAVMKTHVSLGDHILNKASWLKSARDVVLYHHEKYDGSGYPAGLSGEHIPLAARIFSIVDVFDALTSRRPYKEPMSLAVSLDILHKNAGRHFDPQLVSAFQAIAPELYSRLSAMDDEVVEGLLAQAAEKYYGLD